MTSRILSPRAVRRLRRIVAADRCASAIHGGVTHEWEYGFYPLVFDGAVCSRCGATR